LISKRDGYGSDRQLVIIMSGMIKLTRRAFGFLIPALLAAVPATPPTSPPTTRPAPRNAVRPVAPPFMLGVSLSAAEFGEKQLPGEYGKNYIYPTAKELDYYRSKGVMLIRLPFRWERLQPVLSGPFDATELKRIDEFVAAIAERGMKVIPEPHNYARYREHLIGTTEVPYAAFADFWRRFAEHLKGENCIYGYGLVNEPHDTKGLWPAAAQAATDAIRTVDHVHHIFVPGDGWSGAPDWRKNNENLWITDPVNKIVYEGHLYFDANKSGTYTKTYELEKGSPTVGIDRLRGFVAWLEERNAVGFVGEFGIPANEGDDPRWLDTLGRFVQHLHELQMPGCYWAGGPSWGNYRLSIEPRGGVDRPQMKVLMAPVEARKE
jgi:endoglucanase